MRVISIVGARPQFIKAAPLSRTLRQQHEEYLIHTGQHYNPEMSDIFFKELSIPHPDHNLGIGGLSNLEQLCQMMLALRPLIENYKPDWIVVYGDTNSTLAGALAGKLSQIRVAHIEAGLRSYNQVMPEETNRVLTDHISTVLFCPTQVSADNLSREGITSNVFVVGDVMIDVLLENKSRIQLTILHSNHVEPERYYVATIHRASNVDNPEVLSSIFEAFAQLDYPVILPSHPRLQKALKQFRVPLSVNIRLIDPVGYAEMLSLISSARVVLTDSGGLQKEAYALSIPCVTLRGETEWIETVHSGWNRLAGTAQKRIIKCVEEAENIIPESHPPFYGDGQASAKIVKILSDLL
jgi:UDP-GlcNAc3NAcA epimerase